MEDQWVAVESQFQGTEVEIAKAKTPYQLFQKDQMHNIRIQLEAEGKPCNIADVMRAVGVQWKNMDVSERKKYEDEANEDRLRYEAECEKRDAEILAEQEKKRLERESTVVEGTRKREGLYAEAPKPKDTRPRAPIQYSEEVLEKRRIAREEKAAEAKAIKEQEEALRQKNAQQAEQRLKFLVQQSDVFKQLGMVDNVEKANVNGKSKGKGHRGTSNDDEDVEEENNEVTYLTQQPSCISFGKMRKYQLEGLNWMINLQNNGINGILADEMGLGKTLQSISVLAFNYEFRNISGPHLILVPKSTLANWMNEIKRWCPPLRPIRFHGTKDERMEFVAEYLNPAKERTWDVLVTTYEIANMEKKALEKIVWQYLIIDEAHRIKNEDSQFSKTVRMLRTKHRLLITGTPLQNNLHELWALLNFLLPDIFGSSEQFDEWFNLEIDDADRKKALIAQLHKILRPFMIRRLKVEVETSLPPKTETLVFCGMAKLQKETYRRVLERDLSVISGAESAGKTAILNIVMQLRKACNHPYLFQGVEDRTLDPLGPHLIQNCGKLRLMDKLLQNLYKKGHRVLIFCQMTRMLDILEDFLYMTQYKYCRIDGNTSYDEREALIDAYNAPNSEKFAFLLSTRAGGLGINLQTADTVILYDSDWNPQADLQAQDRAHRIGQKKPVSVYRLVTENSIEEKIVERAQTKLKLDAMVVQSGRLAEKDKMNKDQLLDAVKFGAEMVFRAGDDEVTDEDIELILNRGRQRTDELNAKLQAADKGDLLDFRLDGGMNAQQFEGQDFSRKAQNQKEQNIYKSFLHIDLGKRERKVRSNLNENALLGEQVKPRKMSNKQTRLPKQFRLGKIEDPWMFYDHARLYQIQALEEKAYKDLKLKGEIPDDPSEMRLLPYEIAAEKEELLKEGFGDWTKYHYQNFIKSCAKYGRTAYDKIAEDIGKTEAEVALYSQTFWERCEELNDFEKIKRNVEKGEKKLEEIKALSQATRALISRFANPWEELHFQFAQIPGKAFSPEEDRYLLCFADYLGYGNWDRVKMAIRKCDRFRFDYFLRSCSSENIGKRCEQLMKAAEKENTEYERKRQSIEENKRREKEERLKEEAAREKEDAQRRERLAQIDEEIRVEEEHLRRITDERLAAETRYNMLKGKYPDYYAANGGVNFANLGNILTGAPGRAKPGPKPKNGNITAMNGLSSTSARKVITGGDGEDGMDIEHRKTPGPEKGKTSKIVPDEFVPELCAIISVAGKDAINSIASQFLAAHPDISKRQVDIKINELAVKERRNGLNNEKIVWYLHPQYEQLLNPEEVERARQIRENGNAANGGDRRLSSSKNSPGAAKVAIGDKRKRVNTTTTSSMIDSKDEPAYPKKAKNAVTLFMNHNRTFYENLLENELGKKPSREELIERVKKAFNSEISPEEKKSFKEKAITEKNRFLEELGVFKAFHGDNWEEAERAALSKRSKAD